MQTFHIFNTASDQSLTLNVARCFPSARRSSSSSRPRRTGLLSCRLADSRTDGGTRARMVQEENEKVQRWFETWVVEEGNRSHAQWQPLKPNKVQPSPPSAACPALAPPAPAPSPSPAAPATCPCFLCFPLPCPQLLPLPPSLQHLPISLSLDSCRIRRTTSSIQIARCCMKTSR